MTILESSAPMFMFGITEPIDGRRIRFDLSLFELILRPGDFSKARHRRTGKYYAIAVANDQWYIGPEVLP